MTTPDQMIQTEAMAMPLLFAGIGGIEGHGWKKFDAVDSAQDGKGHVLTRRVVMTLLPTFDGGVALENGVLWVEVGNGNGLAYRLVYGVDALHGLPEAARYTRGLMRVGTNGDSGWVSADLFSFPEVRQYDLPREVDWRQTVRTRTLVPHGDERLIRVGQW